MFLKRLPHPASGGSTCTKNGGTTMKRRASPVITRTIALGLVVAVLSACNMAAQDKQQEGGEYASQAQALTGGGGALAGTPRLQYDHKFQFEKGDVRVDIAIAGEIPLTASSASKMVFECSPSTHSETTARVVYQYSGSGKVNIGGTADWSSETSGCVCSLGDTIEVNIQGVEFPAWGKPGSGGSCQETMVALKVMETWNTAPAWQCTCNTPEDVEKMHIEENLAAFSQWRNPELEKKTMIFPMDCPGDSDLVANLSMFGTGDYWWTFHRGANEGPNRYEGGLGYGDYTPSAPKELINCPAGEWGPPLESVIADNPVPKWEPMQ
jgi:hypothetical protein